MAGKPASGLREACVLGSGLPDWVLLARIVSLGKVRPPVFALIWRREWQLALGVVLREVDQAEADTL